MAAPPIDTSTEIRMVDDCDFGSERLSGRGAASTIIDLDAVAEGDAVAEVEAVGVVVEGGERVGVG